MIYLDTNVILRYLLKDHADFFNRAINLIESDNVYIKNEVFAEVVYVLHKTYSVPKLELMGVLTNFINMNTVHFDSKEVALLALKLFSEYNIDFVDALLCAYQRQTNVTVITFDKRLNDCLCSKKLKN